MEILILIFFFNVPDITTQIHQEISFSLSRRKALMVDVHSCPKTPYFLHSWPLTCVSPMQTNNYTLVKFLVLR